MHTTAQFCNLPTESGGNDAILMHGLHRSCAMGTFLLSRTLPRAPPSLTISVCGQNLYILTLKKAPVSDGMCPILDMLLRDIKFSRN